MWDIKLLLLQNFFFFENIFYFFIWNLLNFITLISVKSSFFVNWFYNFYFPQNNAIIFSFKFVLCICFLILIRGGTPRYRYDYLTKLGWLKFLSLILLILLFNILIYFLF